MEKSRISTSKLIKLLNGYKERAKVLEDLCALGLINAMFPEIKDAKTYALTITQATIELVDDIIKELNLE